MMSAENVTFHVFESMIGVTMLRVEVRMVDVDHEAEMVFASADRQWRFAHERDCCERVEIDDVCGDLADLVGSPIVQAEEVRSDPPEDHTPDDTETWTFYKFATAKGAVTVRWYGTSSGYYSEEVQMTESEVQRER